VFLQVLDRYVTRQALGSTNMHITSYYRAKLETYVVHSHPQGLLNRFVQFHDTACTMIARVTESFGRRNDGLYKRVRHVDTQCVEQHFEQDHFAGVAMIVDTLGKRQELYFYPGARVDGLRQRVHEYGVKISEYYGDTPNRLWYRSLSLAPHGLEVVAVTRSATPKPTTMVSTLTVEVGLPSAQEVAMEEDAAVGGRAPEKVVKKKMVMMPAEQAIRKMTEKYRRDPTGATPAHADFAKVVYLLDSNAIQVNFHHAQNRITASARLYQKPAGKYEPLSVDPYAPVPRVSSM
jgi:hypothetical protein